MKAEEKQKLKASYTALAGYYQIQLSDTVLAMYAEDLSDLPLENILVAMKIIRRDPKFARFPLPAQIRAVVEGPKANPKFEALDLSKKIIAAIRRNGWAWSELSLCNGEEGFWGNHKLHPSFKEAVVSELGELAFEVIERRGGWNQIHDEYFASDPTTFTAQLRDHIEAVIEKAQNGSLKKLPPLPVPGSCLIPVYQGSEGPRKLIAEPKKSPDS